MKLILLLILVCVAWGSFAQNRKPAAFDTVSHRITPSSFEKHAQLFYGMPFGEFSALTQEGKTITNSNLAGKVSLILFWYPRYGSPFGKLEDRFLQLGSIPSLRTQLKNFQIISLMADTVDLALFRSQHPEDDLFTPATLPSHSLAKELCPGRGIPACVLVDRNGNIAWTSALDFALDEQTAIDKIRELTMQ